MKHEPLKGKIKESWKPSDISSLVRIEYFLKSDVKSAVDGLLEEIENQSYHRNEEDWGNLESDYVINLEDVRFLIKKWFPDVLKEEK